MTGKEKKQITDILLGHGVVVGYLFGSAARGTRGSHSDIDVAVFFDEKEVPEEKQEDEKLRISYEIAKAFSVEDADVINLNQDKNPVLRYDAVLLGEVLLCKNPSIKNQLARAVLRAYENTRHLRETSYRILREQVKSGEFGRASVTSKKYVSSQ